MAGLEYASRPVAIAASGALLTTALLLLLLVAAPTTSVVAGCTHVVLRPLVDGGGGDGDGDGGGSNAHSRPAGRVVDGRAERYVQKFIALGTGRSAGRKTADETRKMKDRRWGA